MRKYSILHTEKFDEGLRDIILYSLESFGSEVAERALARIENAISELELTPEIGSTLRYSVLRRRGYRVLIVDKWLIFYRFDSESKLIVLYAIVDGRRDYAKLI